jgi:UDP-3-O-[3-hydroxymyristoyl] N-acetylglucosamine deacetylase
MLKSTRQHTLKNPVTVSGIGVHSGAPANMTLSPATANSGIVFVRTDIQDRDNVIPAKWDNVTETRLCTVLANKAGASVSTVEHVLSACAALGLDNAVINIDGPEIPIMDGSAHEFVAAIDATGLKKLGAPRRMLRIKKTVTVRDGDKEALLGPADGQFYGFEIAFDNATVGRQKYTHEFTEQSYRRDIARARTFGFLHEVEQLRKMGFARGGSLDNAIVIDGDKVLNPGGLRFTNEFVRHKILDAVGDLYLCGLQIIGHYHGVKAGHAMNNKLLHALFAAPDSFELVTPEEAPARARVDMPHAMTA